MPGVIDGRAWLLARRDHLRELLAALPGDGDQRVAAEAELATIERELGAHRRSWRRWFLWGGRVPEQ